MGHMGHGVNQPVHTGIVSLPNVITLCASCAGVCLGRDAGVMCSLVERNRGATWVGVS